MSNIKIGLVGVNSPAYYAKEYRVYEQSVKGLEALGKKYGFDTVCFPKLIETADEAVPAKEFMLQEKVDFLLIQNAAFSMGDVMEVLANTGLALGLWAVGEPENENDVKLHSLVSLNMYTSIIKRCFKDRQIKYKWFFGNVDTQVFIERFKPTILALKAINKLKNARICWVGSVAPTFNNMKPDINALKERFGVNIDIIPTLKVKAVADSLEKKEIDEAGENFCRGIKKINVTKEMLSKGAVVYTALSKIAREYGFDAMALACWPDFQELFGIVPCVPFTEIYDDDNIPVSCEGDLQAAITMLVLNAMTGSKSMVMDFANVDIGRDMLLLWHCGIGTKDMAACCQDISIINHPMMNRKMSDEYRMGLSYDYYFKETHVTVARISDNGDGMFFFNGEITNDKCTGFTGTRGWIKNINFQGEQVSVLDLMDTVLTEGIEHHLVMAEGVCGNSFSEFAYWTGGKVIKPSRYRNYL